MPKSRPWDVLPAGRGSYPLHDSASSTPGSSDPRGHFFSPLRAVSSCLPCSDRITRIETQNPEDKIAERRERDGAGRVTHARYFHLHRRISDSSANELKTRGIEPDWARLGAPYDPRELASLRKIGKTRALGRRPAFIAGVWAMPAWRRFSILPLAIWSARLGGVVTGMSVT